MVVVKAVLGLLAPILGPVLQQIVQLVWKRLCAPEYRSIAQGEPVLPQIEVPANRDSADRDLVNRCLRID